MPNTEKSLTQRATGDMAQLAVQIKRYATTLGFTKTGVSDIDLAAHEGRLDAWLAAGRHGEMHYMERHGSRRARPAELVPGALRVISVRMDYYPETGRDAAHAVLDDAQRGFISRYALGRDYHKVMRRRLQQLADHVVSIAGPFGYRAFVDSAPVLEKALAEKAGLGWIGKHTNLISRDHGSWFFLGELFTDLPLPIDQPAENHCGTCRACLDICPTQAIIAPYELDARRCISYLTIELRGSIPLELRPLIGNRIYGCDDCQLVCPWNRFATMTTQSDFLPRHGLDAPALLDLFGWSEEVFLQRTAGSAIRRIGYECWQRNIAVALGNCAPDERIIAALQARLTSPSALVREHVEWALERQRSQKNTKRF